MGEAGGAWANNDWPPSGKKPFYRLRCICVGTKFPVRGITGCKEQKHTQHAQPEQVLLEGNSSKSVADFKFQG